MQTKTHILSHKKSKKTTKTKLALIKYKKTIIFENTDIRGLQHQLEDKVLNCASSQTKLQILEGETTVTENMVLKVTLLFYDCIFCLTRA